MPEQVTPEIPLALLGGEVDRDTHMGLVNRCVPDAAPDETASARARQLAGCGPAQARTEQLLEAHQSGTVDDAPARGAEAQVADAATTYYDTTAHDFRTTRYGARS